MRRILLNRARDKNRVKRGGERHRVDLDQIELALDTNDEQLLELDDALNRTLTPGEVMGIYSAGTAGKIKTSTYVAADFPSVTEGAAGTTTSVTFMLQRVGNLSGQVAVNWTTANNTALAGSD